LIPVGGLKNQTRDRGRGEQNALSNAKSKSHCEMHFANSLIPVGGLILGIKFDSEKKIKKIKKL